VKEFVGLDNFLYHFRSDKFLRTAINSFYLVSISTSLTFILGFILALIVNKLHKFRAVFTMLILPPLVITPAVSGRLWQLVFSLKGPFPLLLTKIGLEPISVIAKAETALLGVILVDIWQWTPFVFMILLAGLSSLPMEQYEAAGIDGANEFQKFIHLTIPNLRKVIFIVLIFRIIDTFRVFDIANVLTEGGPGISTEVFSLQVYKYGLRTFELGKSSSLAFSMLIVSIVFFTVLLKKIKMFE